MENKVIYIAILLTLILAVLFTACEKRSFTQEVDPDLDNEIKISTNLLGTNFHDDKIKELRIMVFNTSNGELVYNKYYGFADEMGDEFVRIHLELGTYDFAFIANEQSDRGVHEELINFGMEPFSTNKTLKDLYENVAFKADAFSADKHIPMSHIEKGVKITGIRTLELSNSTQYTDEVWPVILTRLAVRLDLEFYTELADKKTAFKRLIITQIPRNVPMFQRKFDDSGNIVNGGTGNYSTIDREVLLANGDTNDWVVSTKVDNTQDPPVAITYYTWKKTRIILPATMFNPDSDKSQGIVVQATYDIAGTPNEGGVPGLHTPGTIATEVPGRTPGVGPYDYTLPRNTYVKYTGKIVDNDIIFEGITVSNWVKVPDVPLED